MAPVLLHSLHFLPFQSPFLSKHSNLPTFLPFLSIFLENINFSSNPPEILSQVLVRTLSVVDYGGTNREFGGHEERSKKYCVWQVRNGEDFGTRHLHQSLLPEKSCNARKCSS
ncbi:hypothetical protein Ddye_019928 [Dipteronia dyeriana]|uniref:Uncharacterized protein n=1 Tax=Dipteronia dyeriana TaxID=168575 RepID=A0AAD9WW31_9ROSI|nr:hypothetical protein Ddye_019928 [Dipteronia dyeriana]